MEDKSVSPCSLYPFFYTLKYYSLEELHTLGILSPFPYVDAIANYLGEGKKALIWEFKTPKKNLPKYTQL